MAVDYDVLMAFCLEMRNVAFDPAILINDPGEDLPAPGVVKPNNYIQLYYLPNQTGNDTLDEGTQQHVGLIQVSIYWRSGEGYGQPLLVAGQIVNHFKKTKTIYRNGLKIVVDSEPWVSGPIQEDDRLQIPVNLSWHTFA